MFGGSTCFEEQCNDCVQEYYSTIHNKIRRINKKCNFTNERNEWKTKIFTWKWWMNSKEKVLAVNGKVDALASQICTLYATLTQLLSFWTIGQYNRIQEKKNPLNRRFYSCTLLYLKWWIINKHPVFFFVVKQQLQWFIS